MAKKIKVWLSIGLSNVDREDVFDVPDDWESMTKREQDDYIEDAVTDFRNNHLDYGGRVIEESDR